MKVVLIGFMGAGKSSVAKELASKLQYEFVEMDDHIVQKSGRKDVSEIFAVEGEARFRELEQAVAEELKQAQNTVISTGGGVIESARIIECLKVAPSQVVYLRSTFETICRRLDGVTNRPLFMDRVKAREIYNRREKLYADASSIVIDTDSLEISQVVDHIISSIPSA